MKKFQLIDLIADIKTSIVSFASILMFVTLGIGIYVGISWTAPALYSALDTTFDEGNMHDALVQFPYGLTDNDIEQLRSLDGVDEVETGRSDQRTLKHDARDYIANVLSLTGSIDTPVQVEGSLPTGDDELAVERAWALEHEVELGTTLSFTSSSASLTGDPRMTNDSFTVTALVELPQYAALNSASYGISSNGSSAIDCIMLAAPDAFNAAAFRDSWTDAYVRSNSLRGIPSYGDTYKTDDAQLTQSITELGDTLGSERYTALHDEAQAKVDSGREKIAQGEQKLEEGKRQVDEGEKKVADAKKELAAGKQEGEEKLADAKQQLDEGEEAYAAAVDKLEAAEEELAQAEAQIAQADTTIAQAKDAVNNAASAKSALDKKLKNGSITQKEYDAQLKKLCTYVNREANRAASRIGSIPDIDVTPDNFDASIRAARSALGSAERTKVEYDGKTTTLAQVRKKAASARQKIESGRTTLQEKRTELDNGWSRYEDGRRELEEKTAQAQREIAQGEEKVASGKQQIEKGERKLAEKREQLAAGEEKLASMVELGWVVTSRVNNGGLQAAKAITDVMFNLRYSMAALFLIVGLLVCYSAVSRLVNEQVVQIGTKKAIGLRNREIYAHYLLYAGLAVLLGSIAGLAAGTTIVEGILSHTVGKRFITGPYPPYFSPGEAIAVCGLELVLIELATWAACRSMLVRHAVELLRGAQPPAAKTRFYEKWALWKRLPLYTKTIVTNCFNEKRRVFSTIVGVAGSTALIITAMTLNDNVLASFDTQYQDVYHYSTVITYAGDEADASLERASSMLAEDGLSHAKVQRGTYLLDTGNGIGTATVTVPADGQAYRQLTTLATLDGGAVDLDAEGVWVNNAYGEHHAANIGDEITIVSTDGKTYHLKIAGFFRHYLTTNQIVTGPATYRTLFEEDPAYNTLLVGTYGTAATEGELYEELSSLDGFVSVQDERMTEKKNFDDFSNVSTAVVAIYLVLSVLMAVVVLLNLNVMCIEEKKRELIVLMINGFSTRDAKRYIYRDTIALTALGIIAGIVLGCTMGSLTVLSVEPDTASFIKNIDWLAVACGAAGSAVLAAIMCAIALTAIPKFDLTDINKQ